MAKIISITPKAIEKVKQYIKEDKNNPKYLRVYVQGGGCSGLSYGMTFETEVEDDDMVTEENGVKILIDSYSEEYLQGTNLDWVDTLMGSGFKFKNPNVTKSCSCGESFSTE